MMMLELELIASTVWLSINNQINQQFLFSMAGNYRRLDVASAIQHMAENLLQARQGRLAGDVVGRTNLLCRDQAKCSADSFRCVMERCLEGDLGVVQAIRFQLHLGPAGASAKEIHGAA